MLPPQLRPALLFCLTALCGGCSTLSPLYVSSSGPERSYPPAPPALIRLPVMVTVPQVDGLGHGLSELFQGNLKEGVPDLAHWTGTEGFKISKQLALWNVTGGKLVLGTTIHWLESSGEKIDEKGTPVPGKDEKASGSFQVGFPLVWNQDWRLAIPFPTPIIENKKKSFPQNAAETLLKIEGSYTHIQLEQLNKVLKGITDLRPKAADIWDLMQDPIYLDKGIWLLIHPDNIATGVMRPDPHNPLKLVTVLEMSAYPVIYFGDSPAVEKKPLPPLQPYQEGRPGFRAISNAFISFKEATSFLTDPHTGLINTIIPGTGAQKLTVRGIRLYGAGEKVIAEVKLSYNPFLINLAGKPAQMTIYFRGTPHYNLRHRVFYMPDLDFDVKTSDFLVQVADWILKSDIRKELRKKARIPVGPKLDFIQERMNIVLNRKLNSYASLATQVHSLRILDAFADRDGLKARISLDGDAQLNVVW